MTSYALCPPDTVLRCPVDGSLYLRRTDGDVRDWLAWYVDTAARIALDPQARGDAFEWLATSELPPGLVLLVPAATATSAPVAEPDLADEMDALVNALFAPVAGVS